VHEQRVGVAAGTFSDLAALERTADVTGVDLHVVTIDTPRSLTSLGDCDALIVGLHALRAEHFAAMPQSVRVIGRAGIGLDSIDLSAAETHGIAVVHQPDYATDEVATHAVALLLALARRVVLGDHIARTAWPSWSEFRTIRSLSESTVGIIGLGRIGRAVAARLAPTVKNVIGFDPAAVTTDGIETVDSLDQLLEATDVVSLHVPLLPETTNLIDESALTRMRPGSLLVNVSRGGLIDADAALHALQTGHLGGLAVDVLDTEPPASDHPLLRAPNTIVTPHMAWLSSESQDRLQHWTLQSVVDTLRGDSVQHGRVAVAGTTR
jgi:D-3-phosphoglycerate dehydrogenase / 2-oxoglutarate reductase